MADNDLPKPADAPKEDRGYTPPPPPVLPEPDPDLGYIPPPPPPEPPRPSSDD